MAAIFDGSRGETRKTTLPSHKRGHRVLAAASALLSAAGLALVVVSPASATTTQSASMRPSSAAHLGGGSAPAARRHVLPRVTGLGKGEDYKRVCGTPSVGHAACMALERTNVKVHTGITPETVPSGYAPADLQAAYNLPSSKAGNGETVAVVDAYDNPNAEADLGVYRAQYGLPPCTTANGCFEKVNQEGQQGNYPPVDSSGGWEEEESLDVDMVSAACPSCHILLVEANSASFADLGAAVDEAVALGAKYVSNSYGGSESSSELQLDAYYNHPGVVITASAGDSGYGAQYPAASQYVTTVGGTTLTQDSSVGRGWAETVWSGTGSGCSAYEPKPSWQHDTGCANRTEDDVAAVADPNTGVAIYDSGSAVGGWTVVGGTSVASPLIASVYALAGKPAEGTYPASYPYAAPSALYDVTSGTNAVGGYCSPSYLCTARRGYDGPTGLGTPDGVAAFTGGPHGRISGRVIDAATGQPIAGVEVNAQGGASGVTSANGHYSMTLLTGKYTVTAADYGYHSQAVKGVTVTAGTVTSENFTLTVEPTATVTGTVADGSGQGWPLYASISISGVPGAPVYTNPYTGAYRVTLPQDTNYTMTVTPVAPGYQATTQQIRLGTRKLTQNIAVPVSTGSTRTTGGTCEAPGYGLTGTGGITQAFTGWAGTTPRHGWTVTDNEGHGQTWEFGSDPAAWGPDVEPPVSDGQYAFVDSYAYGQGNSQNTSLVSPVINMSSISSPAIAFDTNYKGYQPQAGDVSLSIDGGKKWATVWSQTTTDADGLVVIPISPAAGQSDVRVKFTFTATWGNWWSLDNIVIGGNAGCNPLLRGGMVAGVVKDGNTGQPVNGALVSPVSAPSASGITAATSGNPAIPGGFYEFFSPVTGIQKLTAADTRYTSQTQAVAVSAGAVTEANFTLQAGRLKVTPEVSGVVSMGDSLVKKVTITNTGKVAAQVGIGEQVGSFANAARDADTRGGAPLHLVKGHYHLSGALPAHPQSKPATAQVSLPTAPVGASWSQIPSFAPESSYSVAAYDSGNGKLYSVGGYDTNNITDVPAEVYDPETHAWTAIAPPPLNVAGAAGAFLDGKLYVYGGFNSCGAFCGSYELDTQIYNPATNSWRMGPGLPEDVAPEFAGVATLDGRMYLVGGCPEETEGCNAVSRNVFRYDPTANSWAAIAPYPLLAAALGCAGVADELVCTGGINPVTGATYRATYIYNAATNTWSRGASLPIDLWGMGYAAANGQFLVSDGATADSTELTNQGFAYTPATNTWTALPNSVEPRFAGGSACGFFQIGGYKGGAETGGQGAADSEELPGYGGCGTDGTQVPWLTESPTQFTIPAHGSVTIALTLNGGSAAVTQPGAYTADLELSGNTPYGAWPVTVTMHVTPPKTWGEITGTVSGTTCGGTAGPLAGATVQVNNTSGDQTLTTAADGRYNLWLDRDGDPLSLIVADDGWKTQTRKARIMAGHVTTVNFTLTPQEACS